MNDATSRETTSMEAGRGAPPPPDAVITARDVRKRFGTEEVVRGIDFDVRGGQCFGLPGPNGAGKTTTIRMILGQSPLTRGELRVFGEPLLYLLGLGYGLGLFICQMAGMPYLTYLASGIIASTAMNAATFEGMYSVYTRMVPQRTYDAMLATPLDVDDVLAGEMLWCATKSLFSGSAILLVAWLLGATSGLQSVLALPVVFLTGLCFAGPAMVMSAISPGYYASVVLVRRRLVV